MVYLEDNGAEVCIMCGVKPVPMTGMKCYGCTEEVIAIWRETRNRTKKTGRTHNPA